MWKRMRENVRESERVCGRERGGMWNRVSAYVTEYVGESEREFGRE